MIVLFVTVALFHHAVLSPVSSADEFSYYTMDHAGNCSTSPSNVNISECCNIPLPFPTKCIESFSNESSLSTLNCTFREILEKIDETIFTSFDSLMKGLALIPKYWAASQGCLVWIPKLSEDIYDIDMLPFLDCISKNIILECQFIGANEKCLNLNKFLNTPCSYKAFLNHQNNMS